MKNVSQHLARNEDEAVVKGGKVIEGFFGLNEIDNKTEAVFAKEKRSKLIPGGVPYVMGAERDLVLVYMTQVLASNVTLLLHELALMQLQINI